MDINNTRNAYAILMGRWPLASMVSDEDCMNAVMQSWNGSLFDGNRYLERIARMALCEILLFWSKVRASPDARVLVSERLREMCPAFGDNEIFLEDVHELYQHDASNPV